MKTFLALFFTFVAGIAFDHVYLQHPGRLGQDVSSLEHKVSEAAKDAEKQ